MCQGGNRHFKNRFKSLIISMPVSIIIANLVIFMNNKNYQIVARDQHQEQTNYEGNLKNLSKYEVLDFESVEWLVIFVLNNNLKQLCNFDKYINTIENAKGISPIFTNKILL